MCGCVWNHDVGRGTVQSERRAVRLHGLDSLFQEFHIPDLFIFFCFVVLSREYHFHKPPGQVVTSMWMAEPEDSRLNTAQINTLHHRARRTHTHTPTQTYVHLLPLTLGPLLMLLSIFATADGGQTSSERLHKHIKSGIFFYSLGRINIWS